jgi:hypothetical protein
MHMVVDRIVIERFKLQMKATSYLNAVLDQEGPAQTMAMLCMLQLSTTV